MNKIIMDFAIALALSMDAFSISICMTTSNLLNKRKMFIFTILVGILHFVMPLLGNYIGLAISINLEKIANYILGIIFLILGIEVLNSKEKEEIPKINYLYLAIIAITVSIDSFTVGLGLSLTHEYTYISSMIFSIVSFSFTILGLTIGKYLNEKIEKKATIIGGILLIMLSIKYFLKL